MGRLPQNIVHRQVLRRAIVLRFVEAGLNKKKLKWVFIAIRRFGLANILAEGPSVRSCNCKRKYPVASSSLLLQLPEKSTQVPTGLDARTAQSKASFGYLPSKFRSCDDMRPERRKPRLCLTTLAPGVLLERVTVCVPSPPRWEKPIYKNRISCYCTTERRSKISPPKKK